MRAESNVAGVFGQGSIRFHYTRNVRRDTVYNGFVIVSFRCAETEKIFHEKPSRRFGNIQRVAFRRLVLLDSADALSDLSGPGAALEALKRDRKGQHAIRVNDQYRICFTWKDGTAADVEIADYH